MTILVSSIVILWLAPILWLSFAKSRFLVRAEKFAVVLVFLVLLIGFVPHHVEEDGILSLVFLGLSGVLFYLLERGVRWMTTESSRFSILFFGVFLVLHGVADGVGLGLSQLDVTHSHHQHSTEVLAFSIVLHRLPAGLGIWSFLYPRFQWTYPAILTLLMSLATILGYGIGTEELSVYLEGPQIHILEYLIAGGLFHFGFHAVSHTKGSAS